MTVLIMNLGEQSKIPKNLIPASLTIDLNEVFEKVMAHRLVAHLVRLQSFVHFVYSSGRSITDCVVTDRQDDA